MDSVFVVVAGMFGLVLIVVLACVYWLRNSFLKWFAVSTGIIVFVSWLAGFLYAQFGRVMLVPNTLVLTGVYIAILQIFVRYVRRYINEISGGLQQVAQGNLRYRSKDKLRPIKNERRLADMSAKAAQEIQDLSTHSPEAVEQMGGTLRAMLPGVQRIAGVVREISAASDEQNAGIAQVNTALAQLAQVTSTNASSPDELNAMAVKLVNDATDLRGAVSRFSL